MTAAGVTRFFFVVFCCCWSTPRDPNLQFVEQPALQPPEFVINQADQQRFQLEIEAAAAVPLPDEDDEL